MLITRILLTLLPRRGRTVALGGVCRCVFKRSNDASGLPQGCVCRGWRMPAAKSPAEPASIDWRLGRSRLRRLASETARQGGCRLGGDSPHCPTPSPSSTAGRNAGKGHARSGLYPGRSASGVDPRLDRLRYRCAKGNQCFTHRRKPARCEQFKRPVPAGLPCGMFKRIAFAVYCCRKLVVAQ